MCSTTYSSRGTSPKFQFSMKQQVQYKHSLKMKIINEIQSTSIGRIVSNRKLLGISNPSIEVIPPTLSATAQLPATIFSKFLDQ
jgi:hypothetical protein